MATGRAPFPVKGPACELQLCAGPAFTGAGTPRRPSRDYWSALAAPEYAIGTVAAAAFGAILYQVVTGESIVGALTEIVQRALTSTF